MINVLKILKKYWLQLLILLISVIVQVYVNLELPDYLAQIINKGIIASDQQLILRVGTEMIIIAFIGGLATVITGYHGSKIGSGFSKDLREKIFVKIQCFSLKEFNRFTVSSLITRSTNDVQQIQMILILVLRMVLAAPITGISAVIKAYEIAPSMSWIIAIAISILFLIIILLIFNTMPKFDIVQVLTDKLSLVTRQNLTGIRVIRAFNTEELEKKKFNDVNSDLLKTNLFINRSMAIMRPMMMLIMNVTSILVIWIGAHLLSDFKIEVGNLLAFMQYSMQAIMSFLMISMVLVMIPRASASIKRVDEILNTDLSITDNKVLKKFKPLKGKLEFKNVSFKYNDADQSVLNNISFTARPGQTTAIVGGTGSGKSTLINLIPRFYDPTSGIISIDEIDIKEIKQKNLRNIISYVPQKPFIFSGTIASNIKFGKKYATDKEMKKSSEIAQASEFINKLKDKYETDVAQLGTNLSGGQKQRLAIARAIIMDTPILIFDDSFSALDYKTEANLRKALASNLKNKTVLIVTQRISSILNADQIIVLNEGKVVGIGKHEYLFKTCKVYKEIVASQLSSSEIERSIQ